MKKVGGTAVVHVHAMVVSHRTEGKKEKKKERERETKMLSTPSIRPSFLRLQQQGGDGDDGDQEGD